MHSYKHFLTRLGLLLSVSILLALGLTGVTTAAATPKAVTLTVGPGFSIRFTVTGKQATTLKAGAPYRLTIRDRS